MSSLILLATPWDFHAERGDLARLMPKMAEPWLPLIDKLGELPVDALQAMFFGLDPFMVIRKFCNFAHLDPNSARAREFVALEDWLNDGVPLAAAVARECVVGWYGENTPGRGVWEIAGAAPSSRVMLQCPRWSWCPSRTASCRRPRRWCWAATFRARRR